MNKDKNHIDELFKAKLSHQEFVIPDAFVNDLNQKMAPKKNKFFYWFFLASILTLGLSVVLFIFLTPKALQFDNYNQNYQASASSHVVRNNNSLDSNNTKNKSQGDENSISNNSYIYTLNSNQKSYSYINDSITNWFNLDGKDKTVLTNISKNTILNNTGNSGVNYSTNNSNNNNNNNAKTIINSSNETTQKSNSKNTLTQNSQYTNKTKDNNLRGNYKNSDNNSNNNSAKNSASGSSQSNENSNVEKDGNTDKRISKTSSSETLDKNEYNEATTNEATKNSAKNETDLPLESESKDYSEIYLSPSGDSIRIIDSIRYIDSVIVKDSIVIRDSVRIIDSVITEPETKKDFQMELQLFGGYEFSKPSYKPKNFISSDQEQGLGNINTGLLFNVYYKNITAGTGIEYQTTGEKYSFTTITTSSYDSIVISYDSIPILDTNGSQIGTQVNTITDTVTVPTSTQNSVEGKNKYNWINIPIRFGYRFNIKSWAIIPRVGLNFIFGVANDDSDYFNPTTNSIESMPAKSFAMSYHFQLEVRKSFNQVHIFLKPHFNGMITPTHEVPTYSRKYSSFGGQIGIGFQF